MGFPEKEAWAVLDWMNEQMHGETATEWTYGDEYDAMSEAAGFLHMLILSECGEDEMTEGGFDDGEDYGE